MRGNEREKARGTPRPGLREQPARPGRPSGRARRRGGAPPPDPSARDRADSRDDRPGGNRLGQTLGSPFDGHRQPRLCCRGSLTHQGSLKRQDGLKRRAV
ncbi:MULTISPECIES: hypothetical protein [Protofrankia]|uniref:hypothetical protein n=1 Tax=Protofrankia TaxID=2994361 RepID=UPI0011155C7C|nr:MULTISPECIES: hypothetical protein [Protofrankia]